MAASPRVLTRGRMLVYLLFIVCIVVVSQLALLSKHSPDGLSHGLKRGLLKDQLHGKDAEIWRLQRELDLMKPQQVELEELRAKTLTFQKDIVDLNEALLEAQKITNDLNLLKEELRTIKQAAHTHEEDPISQDAQKKPLNAPEPPEPSNLEQLKGAPEDIKDMAHTHDADSNAGEPKIAPLAYPASPKEPPRLDQQLSHKHVSRSAAEEGSGPDALG